MDARGRSVGADFCAEDGVRTVYYPIRDEIAVVGVGTTPYVRSGGSLSKGRLAVDAVIAALEDSGLEREQIDGLAGGSLQASPQYVQEGVGIPHLTWWSTPPLPASLPFLEAAQAVFSGSCSVAVAYHSQLRPPSRQSSDVDRSMRSEDALRIADLHSHNQYYDVYGTRPLAYAGYMRRYMHEFEVGRECFGKLALNSRSHARENEHTCARAELTLSDYLSSPIVRDPMCLLDMDYAVDGGDAFVLTTRATAESWGIPHVVLHAAAYGSHEHPEADKYRTIHSIGQELAMRTLWQRSELALDEMDLLYPYDGFTIIALRWLESFGCCKTGEGPDLVARSWSDPDSQVRINNKVPVNTHGGSLSEGATQGAGHIREAIVQLRGSAGPRQVPAKTALLGVGGLFFNSVALILRSQN